jgi:hypothetical protein
MFFSIQDVPTETSTIAKEQVYNSAFSAIAARYVADNVQVMINGICKESNERGRSQLLLTLPDL